MNMYSKLPLIKIPADIQVSLLLIKEELKTRKLFHTLRKVGFDDCPLQPHLDSLILRTIGLDDGTDETFRIYDAIMERRSRKIEVNNDVITKQAFKVYQELMSEKKRLSHRGK